MAQHTTNTMMRDRRHSRTPMSDESCSETDEDMCCKRTGMIIIALGSALIISMAVYWATTKFNAKVLGGMGAGFILCLGGFMLHGYYKSKIKARKRQESQESEVGQTNARATNASVLTLVTHPHIELDESFLSDAYRSAPLPTNHGVSSERPQSRSSQRSSAMMFDNSQASLHSRQQPVVTYTLLDNIRKSPITRDDNGSQLQHPMTSHTVMGICEASVPEPHLGSVNHEGGSTFHSGRHRCGHSDSPQRPLSTASTMSLFDSNHHVVTSDHQESLSQEGQSIPSPCDNAPPSYDAVMRYSYLYNLPSS